ncbi:MAG: hypothetical protein J6A99_02290 [Clostridia bacterium]|nr:hypothetical protein [Clostridia bacterium]
MTLLDIKKHAALLLGISTNFTTPTVENLAIDTCAKIIVEEVSEQYVDVKHIEKAFARSGKIFYNDLSKKVKSIAVVKRNGQAVKFNEYSTFFTVDKDGEYEVKYNYFPTIEDGIELDIPPRFTTHILGLGIAGEYCFRKGLIDEAEDFRRRFLTALTNVTNTKKSYKIKVVR